MTIDILPTLAKITGTELPPHPIDGLDIRPLLAGQRGTRSPHEALLFYWDQHLQAVRSGPWKLHFPHSYVKPTPPGHGGQPGTMTNPKIDIALFHLETDPSETNNLASARPDVVARLQEFALQARTELGDSATKQTGKGVRESGRAGY
jgi:arylsulfatase A-like enzyme